MMVGSFASRVDRWRLAVEAVEPWDETARVSLYREGTPTDAQVQRGVEGTKDWWQRLQQSSDSALSAGRIA